MNVRQLNVFGEASLDNSIKLAVARDLERLYSPLLTEPIPPNLRSYIDRLEAMEKSERLLGEARLIGPQGRVAPASP